MVRGQSDSKWTSEVVVTLLLCAPAFGKDTYPMQPPFIRIVRPRFQMHTGAFHIETVVEKLNGYVKVDVRMTLQKNTSLFEASVPHSKADLYLFDLLSQALEPAFCQDTSQWVAAYVT